MTRARGGQPPTLIEPRCTPLPVGRIGALAYPRTAGEDAGMICPPCKAKRHIQCEQPATCTCQHGCKSIKVHPLGCTCRVKADQ